MNSKMACRILLVLNEWKQDFAGFKRMELVTKKIVAHLGARTS